MVAPSLSMQSMTKAVLSVEGHEKEGLSHILGGSSVQSHTLFQGSNRQSFTTVKEELM